MKNRPLLILGLTLLTVFFIHSSTMAQIGTISVDPLELADILEIRHLSLCPNINIELFIGEQTSVYSELVYNINPTEKNGVTMGFGMRQYLDSQNYGWFLGVHAKLTDNVIPSYKDGEYCNGNNCTSYQNEDVYYQEGFLVGANFGYRFSFSKKWLATARLGFLAPLKLKSSWYVDESNSQFSFPGNGPRAEEDEQLFKISKLFYRSTAIIDAEISIGMKF